MRKGLLYLVVVMDWYSSKILAWKLSNTTHPKFCVTALREAIDRQARHRGDHEYGPEQSISKS